MKGRTDMTAVAKPCWRNFISCYATQERSTRLRNKYNACSNAYISPQKQNLSVRQVMVTLSLGLIN
jgi:hypothetical protein